MKKKPFLSGIILIGFGIYFLLQQMNFTVFPNLYTWPSLLIIVGIGFLTQGYKGKSYEAILPGVIFTGLGIHFHIAANLSIGTNIAGIFLLVIAIGLLLTYVKTGSGLFQGILFLTASTLLLFFDRLADFAAHQGHSLSIIHNIWPFFFMVAGAYFLFVNKKK